MLSELSSVEQRWRTECRSLKDLPGLSVLQFEFTLKDLPYLTKHNCRPAVHVKCMMNNFILVSNYQIKTAVRVTVQKFALNYKKEKTNSSYLEKEDLEEEFFFTTIH